jgi:murein DD-endopeptidase MepM/ murein hydrolase activator NlpD
MRSLKLVSLALLLLAAACSPAAQAALPTDTATVTTVPPTPTHTLPPTAAPSATPTLTPSPSPLPPTLEPTPEPCRDSICVYEGSLLFIPPIAPPGNTGIDLTYRFGTTSGQVHDPHHGVEFLNSLGTAVLAAADGVVVVAGDDRTIFQGPYSYFYGNVIIVRHEPPPGIPNMGGPLFSLYGHLSEILVQEGEVVRQGQTIGRVGMSGIATGSHLHFEVRAVANTYKNSSNPELWLQGPVNAAGEPAGAFAGRVLDSWGGLLEVENVVLERLDANGNPTGFSVFVRTYEEKILLGQPPFEESFAAGGLPPGRYRLSFAKYGYQQFEVEIFPGKLTSASFVVGD